MTKLSPMKREILQTAQAGPLFRKAKSYSRRGSRRFPSVSVRQLVEAGCLAETTCRSGLLMVVLTDAGRIAIGAKKRLESTPDAEALRLHDRIAP